MQKRKAVFGLALCLLLIGAAFVPAVSAYDIELPTMKIGAIEKVSGDTFRVHIPYVTANSIWAEYSKDGGASYDKSKNLYKLCGFFKTIDFSVKSGYEGKELNVRVCEKALVRLHCSEPRIVNLG